VRSPSASALMATPITSRTISPRPLRLVRLRRDVIVR
jgi:hypothetical protein